MMVSCMTTKSIQLILVKFIKLFKTISHCTTTNFNMNSIFLNIIDWIQSDYKTNPFRFVVEVLAWGVSIGCSITMATTVPNPPLVVLYPIWIAGCAMYAWASWTRRSFGMLANYILLVTIDTVGLLI